MIKGNDNATSNESTMVGSYMVLTLEPLSAKVQVVNTDR